MEPQIAVVDASIGDTPAERNLTREIDAETVVYKASDGVLPPLPSQRGRGYDAVVISGSQTSVYDDHEWIHELTRGRASSSGQGYRCSASVGATSFSPKLSAAGSSIWASMRSATDRSTAAATTHCSPGSRHR
jgi:hypothetical protein